MPRTHSRGAFYFAVPMCILCTILATWMWCVLPLPEYSFLAFPCSLIAAMCFLVSLGEYSALCSDYDLSEVGRESRIKDEQSTRLILQTLLERLAGDVSFVYRSRRPSNETMRSIRCRLLGHIFEGLNRACLPASVLTNLIRPEDVRDFVEYELRIGRLSIEKATDRERALIAFAFEGQPPPTRQGAATI